MRKILLALVTALALPSVALAQSVPPPPTVAGIRGYNIPAPGLAAALSGSGAGSSALVPSSRIGAASGVAALDSNGNLQPPSASIRGGTLSATAPSNQFQTGVSTAGAPQFAQPSFGNLAGTATLGQLPTIPASQTSGLAATANNLSDLGSVTTARVNLGVPTGTSGAVLGFLNANKTDSGNNTFSGTNTFSGQLNATSPGFAAQIGTTTALSAETLLLRTSAGYADNIQFNKGNTQRWVISSSNDAETGNNIGSSLLIGAYSDTGGYLGTLLKGVRASGPLGVGAPYLSSFSPYQNSAPRATVPGGVIGNDTEFTTSGQPAYPLGADPITVTSGNTTATVAWSGCCSAGGSIYSPSLSGSVWINLSGASSVGGITPSGWYSVKSFVDANDFTITLSSPATSTATGGGSSIILTPSFITTADKSFTNVTTGANGFPLQEQKIYAANPAFSASSFYERHFSNSATPNDTSIGDGNPWAFADGEYDFTNRGLDEGYNPILYNATHPTIGFWSGPTPYVGNGIPGGGTGQNWNTVYTVFNGSTSTGRAAVYDAFSDQPNSLVGATEDPSGHGGVAFDSFGSYTALSANPFSVTSGSNVITVSAGSVQNGLVTTGDIVYFPSTYTVGGITFGRSSYAIQSFPTANSFTIIGPSNATSTATAGGANQWASIAKFIPYAPTQFSGEYAHGIMGLNAKFDDGAILRMNPSTNIMWDDGTAQATVGASEISPGNINVTLNPTGTGAIISAGHVGSTGTAPTASVGTINAASTDTRGSVALAASAVSTVITFNQAYASAPYCIAGSSVGSDASAVTATSTTTLTLAVTANAAGTTITYQCMQ
jgi:hypothetical protein